MESKVLMSTNSLGDGDTLPESSPGVQASRRTAAETRHLRLRRHPSSVGEARRLVCRFLKHTGSADLREPAELLTSELVTNALIHGTGAIDLTLLTVEDRFRVEVADQGRRRPQPGSRDSMADTGRGLTMVEQLADSWGVLPTLDGKAVWFHLRHGST